MKKQILAVAIAASLAVPQVGFAAEDDSGMQYTSASEGLFGSLRTRFNTGNKKNDTTKIEADGSVFGYRGSLDLGNGLTGTYHYEQRIQAQDGENLSESGAVRYNFVGLKGAFGAMEFGSHAAFVAGVPNVTDVTANGGGNFVPFYRRGRSIQYVSPELNGFQAGGHIRMLGGSDKDTMGAAEVAATVGNAGTAATKAMAGAPGVDQFAIAGIYKVRGFRVGATYIVDPDEYYSTSSNTGRTADVAGTGNRVYQKEDMTQWFVSGKYAQDNWSVAVMHGQKNTSDNPNSRTAESTPAAATKWQEDETYTSFGGSVTVGKVGLAVLHDVREDFEGEAGMDKTVTAFSATYNFTSRSRVWAAYIANDDDNATDEKDQITIGMRMDF